MNKPESDHRLNTWFSSEEAEQPELLTELRQLLFSVEPAFAEEFKWNRPCYKLNTQVCYLNKFKSYAALGFHRGADLADPFQLLIGSGKEMRHVKVHTMSDAKDPALRLLIANAVELGRLS